MIEITLPDGKKKDYKQGITVAEVARDIGAQLAKDAICAKVGDQLVDLSHKLTENASVTIITADSQEGGEVLRHSASHIMADAVVRLFGKCKLAIGPSIKDGFYYDFDLEHRFTPEDIPVIQKKMAEIAAEDLPFERTEMGKKEALALMEKSGQTYKVELIKELQDEKVSFYRHGEFIDMCRGPHVDRTGRVKHFAILSFAGAYWRGSEKNPMLQRIYGTASANKTELDNYISKLEEAKRRDHRVLGRELDLFSTHAEVGAGLIHWHPDGAVIRSTIEDFWREEHRKRGYKLVYTPHIASERIYHISGHLQNYAENMYSPMDIEGEPYRMKPMNCPGHIMIYKTGKRSYRELPIRYCELGTVYRYERSGVLHGMLRVRGFTQDDAHIFCTQEQLPGEILGVLDLADFMMRTFRYQYRCYLATRPEKFLGTESAWESATEALKSALKARNLDYTQDPGGGLFYGPKIDVKILDALGREWQGPTIQVDFNLPERFDVTYVGADGAEHRVVMIHRTVLGSMERFVGGLIEHYGGNFPLWLAPVQVKILPVTDAQADYVRKVTARLVSENIRAEADLRKEKLSAKIRDAELAKVPYMAIVGEREARSGDIAVRKKKEGDIGSMSVVAFVERLKNEIENRS